MTEYINYFNNDIPAIYKLKPHLDATALKISAHPNFADYLSTVTSNPNIPFFKMVATDLKIPSLKGLKDANNPWGFGDVFTPLDKQEDNWVSWSCQLPSGKNPSNRGFWNDSLEICASLWLFTYLARACGGTTDSTSPQTFFIDLQIERGRGDIVVDLTKDAISWLSQQKETEHAPKIEDAMRNAYGFMMGREPRKDEHFGARIRKPYWLNLQVPEDRVGLDPLRYNPTLDSKGLPISRGYKLYPHNVDNRVRLLTLITGLAALGQAVTEQRREQLKAFY